MEEIVDDPVDCYWLIKSFINQFHLRFGDSVPHLVSVSAGLHGKTQFLLTSISIYFTWSAAEESGALPESGGTSAPDSPEDCGSAAPAAVQPLVQTLLRRLPAWVQPAEVRLPLVNVLIFLQCSASSCFLFFYVHSAFLYYHRAELCSTTKFSWFLLTHPG